MVYIGRADRRASAIIKRVVVVPDLLWLWRLQNFYRRRDLIVVVSAERISRRRTINSQTSVLSHAWHGDGSGAMARDKAGTVLIIRDMLRDLVKIELSMSRHGGTMDIDGSSRGAVKRRIMIKYTHLSTARMTL